MFPRARNRRRAFTLIEVMLTLSLLVVIVALAWPALDKPFANQRLRRSADRIRAEWGRARVKAMDTGEIYLFRFMPEGDRYCIEQGTSAEQAADATSYGQVSRSAGGPASRAATSRRERPLPGGVTFHAGETVADTRSAMLESESTSTSSSSYGSTGEWSQPIYFYPDGTTSTARLALKNEHERYIELSLRGLTGVAYVGEIQAAGESRR